jgi:hypothetical protein
MAVLREARYQARLRAAVAAVLPMSAKAAASCRIAFSSPAAEAEKEAVFTDPTRRAAAEAAAV